MLVRTFFLYATTDFSATFWHWKNKIFWPLYWLIGELVKQRAAYGHILHSSFIWSHVSGHLRKKKTLHFRSPLTPERLFTSLLLIVPVCCLVWSRQCTVDFWSLRPDLTSLLLLEITIREWWDETKTVKQGAKIRYKGGAADSNDNSHADHCRYPN